MIHLYSKLNYYSLILHTLHITNEFYVRLTSTVLFKPLIFSPHIKRLKKVFEIIYKEFSLNIYKNLYIHLVRNNFQVNNFFSYSKPFLIKFHLKYAFFLNISFVCK